MQDEVEVVLVYEVFYVVNGDMVILVLVQGVVNIFVIFFVWVVVGFISNVMCGNDEEGEFMGGFVYMIIVFVFEMIFGVLVSIIVFWFLC